MAPTKADESFIKATNSANAYLKEVVDLGQNILNVYPMKLSKQQMTTVFNFNVRMKEVAQKKRDIV